MSLVTARYQAVQRDVTQIFRTRAQAASPFYPQLCTIVPSNSLDEKYSFLGGLPGMREWIGDRKAKELRAGNFEIRNKHWESTLGIEKTDIDDDRLGTLETQVMSLADEATYHPDELLFTIADSAAESAACFDGQYFFDTDHSWGDSGTQSNLLTYNATDHTAVTSTEFRAAFHAALIKMLGYKNDQNKYLVRPKVGKLGNLVVCVPLTLYEVAVKAFEQVLITNGESNFTLEKPTIVPVQYLTSTVKFDLYYTGGLIKPYIFQARKPLTFQVDGANDLKTKQLLAMTEARYNIGYGAWWTAVRTEFN